MGLEDRIFTVIGAGPWGTALAKVISENHPASYVNLHDIDPKVISEINERHTNSKLSNELKLENNIVGFSDLDEAVKAASYIFIVTRADKVGEVTKQLKPAIKNNPVITCMSKGFGYNEGDNKNPKRLLDIMAEILPENYKKSLVYAAGPNIAKQVALRYPATMTCACRKIKTAEQVSEILSNKYLEVKTTKDVTGLQIAAAAKNCYAMLYGILTEAQEFQRCNFKISSNIIASYYSAALIEMMKLAKYLTMRAHKRTFLSDAGAGDLLVTCMDGRNSNAGREITDNYFLRRIKVSDSLKELENIKKWTIEGIGTAEALHYFNERHIKKHGQPLLPLAECLYEMINDKITLEDAVPKAIEQIKKSGSFRLSLGGSYYDRLTILTRTAMDLFINRE